MELAELEEIRKLAVKAIVSKDALMEILILKGGNAMELVHKVSSRSSIDIDFSMQECFNDEELPEIEALIRERIQTNFAAAGYYAFDVRMMKRPEKVNEELKNFWGGYRVEFKLLKAAKAKELNFDLEACRRNALLIANGISSRFQIDISANEFCPSPILSELDGYTVKVYSLTMIAAEKIRAICQQMDDYKEVVPTITGSARARDFYDIYEIVTNHNIDLLSPENRALIGKMFEAKRVPLGLLKQVRGQREFHRFDFPAVKDSLKPGFKALEYDVYFDFVADICDRL